MKKNKFIILISIILLLLFLGTIYYLYIKNNNFSYDQSQYEVTRTSTENTDYENNVNNTENSNTENNNNNNNKEPKIVETQISSFSTKIYSTDSARQNNIDITCNTLNNVTIKNGETFSFCNTVGQSTTSKGYQKADIFDKNGNKKKGLRWAVIVK